MADTNRETNRNGYQKQLSVGKVWATINGHNTLTISPLAPISTEQVDSTLIISSPETKAHMENFANPHRVTQEQLGLGNVENKDSATIRGEITPTDISNSLGYVPATRLTATNIADGLMSKEDKIKMDGIDSTWSGTVHSVDSGIGLTGGPITNNGTLKLKLRSEANQTNDTVAYSNVSGRQYPVGVDHSGFVSVNVPWTDTTYPIVTHQTDGRMTKEDKIKLDDIQEHSEENQNAFSKVQVDDIIIESSDKTDKLTLTTGHNIILSPNTATKSLNIAAVDTTYDPATQNVHGLMSKEDKKKLDSIAYGECTTAAGTAAKVVSIVKSSTIEDWRLVKGSRIIVKFTNNNTAANVTLNVGNTGAKSIKQYGTTGDFQTYTWNAGSILEFVYDGTNFLLVNGSQATISSYGMTKLSSSHELDSSVIAATPKAVYDTWNMAFKKLDKITLQATSPVSVSGDTTLDDTKKTGTITITHDTSGVTAGNYGTAGTSEVKPAFGATFSVISASVTDKGHISKMEHHNVKIPTLTVGSLLTSGAHIGTITINGTENKIYQKTKLTLGASQATTNATSDVSNPFINLFDNTIYSSQVQINGDTWLIAKGKNGVVNFTHKTTPAITDSSTSLSKGLNAAATPGFGGSFNVPYVTIDRTGHTTSLNHYSVTVPSPTISATITEGATIGTIKINDTTTTFKQKTHLYLGANNATANATSDVDNPYIRLFDNTTPSDSVRVVGSSPIIAKGKNGAITLSHATYDARTSTVTDKSPGFGGTFTVDALTSNGNGHVTALTAKTITLPTLTASNANSNAGSDIGTITINGNAVTFKHPKDLSTAQTTAAIYNVKINTNGHITEATKVTAGTNISLDNNKITNTYTHPLSAAGAKSSGLYKITTDANGHVTAATAATKSDLSLGNVENKSSATIRGELTPYDVTTALGYTPIDKAIGTAKGDIIYYTDSGTPARLGVGTPGQFLKLADGVPVWAADNNTWRGIQDNLTSSSNTTESLSAKQGYLLANGSARDSSKLPLAGGTLTGDLLFSNSGTAIRQIRLQCGDNDYGRIAVGATAANAGWLEIATADDANEPIYVRQYNNGVVRTATLLDASGNTSFPGSLNVVDTIKQNGTAVSLSGHTHTNSQVGLGNVANIDQSKAIKSITRNGTTFTYTCLDDTTGTFTQRDSDTWTPMVGATSSANGTVGYVNAAPPRDGYNTKYLRADGSWVVPPNTTYSFSNKNATLSWGATTTIATVGGTDITVKMPSNPNTNTTYTFSEGTSNGTFSVTPSGGSAQTVSIRGLGNAAYTDSSAYATSSHTHDPMTSPTASRAGTSGMVPAPPAGAQEKFLRGDGTWQEINVSVMGGATATTVGSSGLVPPQPVGANSKFLRGDGSWQSISSGTNYTHPTYTTHSSGLYKITVDATGHVSDTTSVAKSDITGLGIPAQDTTYSAGTGLSLSGTTFSLASHTHGAGDITSGTLSSDRIPSLAASKITSGTLSADRIPSLAASKITSGTFDVGRIPSMSTDKLSSGILPIERGGTGNGNGYVRAGLKSGESAGTYATAEGLDTISSGSTSHAEGLRTQALSQGSHSEGRDITIQSGEVFLNRDSKSIETSTAAVTYATTAMLVGAHAEGGGTLAYGTYSHSEGRNTYAFGSYTHAEGHMCYASSSASHSEGEETRALGIGSHAEGHQTSASGTYSHSEGGGTTASGNFSHAEGCNNTASGQNSHAEGYGTTASGKYSHAEGKKTLDDGTNGQNYGSIGEGSHSEGLNCLASGNYSHAEGEASTTLGYASHAEGSSRTGNSASKAHAEGDNCSATGIASHAEGIGCEAKGQTSHAEGTNTTASGSAAHAEGQGTDATGFSSHAEGYCCLASGDYSHAEGGPFSISPSSDYLDPNSSTFLEATSSSAQMIDTTASGKFSHAEGSGTYAVGAASHTEGVNTAANGYGSHAGGWKSCAWIDYSFAHGWGVRTSEIAQSVFGWYNNTSRSGKFIVGCGDSDARANAFRIDSTQSWAGGTMNASGADYAEMFEWADGNPDNEDRRGRFVTLDGETIKLLSDADNFVLGVVSGFPTVLGDVYDDQWRGMYEYDIYGTPIYEKREFPAETMVERDPETGEEKVKVLSEAHTEYCQKLNPEYNPSIKYIPRSERPEWAAVGMMGKLVMVDDGTSEVNGYVKPSTGGIATKSEERTKYRVMKRLDENHIKVLILP